MKKKTDLLAGVVNVSSQGDISDNSDQQQNG
jgi:hypothetical protein